MCAFLPLSVASIDDVIDDSAGTLAPQPEAPSQQENRAVSTRATSDLGATVCTEGRAGATINGTSMLTVVATHNTTVITEEDSGVVRAWITSPPNGLVRPTPRSSLQLTQH